MSTGNKLSEELLSPLNSIMLTCPTRGEQTSLQLVDENGDGTPYAGIFFEIFDIEGEQYSGYLDSNGKGEAHNHFIGPVSLLFTNDFSEKSKIHTTLRTREDYPLKITELQVRAENTRHLNRDASRTTSNPAQAHADHFYQVEVRELVRHNSHLPPLSARAFPPSKAINVLMEEHGRYGVGLMPGKHTVLEVRPLRALRPMLSFDPAFCALNLYQLALMATLSYTPFGQKPAEHPVLASTVSFPHVPTIGNWFGKALASSEEIWRVDASQQQECFPLYEDVPYSERWEIVPFDPELYAANDPALGKDQENPAKIHFLDDRGDNDSTDTQAFITHNAEVIVIAIRGTSEIPEDVIRDVDALQVPFTEGKGQVHRGFYESAQKAYRFATLYLNRFYQSQQLFICGHSLGGAVALLLAEMLRRTTPGLTLQLYTYGAPRAGDTSFMNGAADLVHHRVVFANDPVPSLPPPWLNTRWDVLKAGLLATLARAPFGLDMLQAGLVNRDGEQYEHHGKLWHFMPVHFVGGERSAILWSPGCQAITERGLCNRVLNTENGLPERALLGQMLGAGDHTMVASYVPGCWATLRRYQQALGNQTPAVTLRELTLIDETLEAIRAQFAKRHATLLRTQPARRALELGMLSHEMEQIQATRQRMATLRHRPISEKDVYGSLAGQPQLAEALGRWQAHPRNQRLELLAQAPTEIKPKLPDIEVVTYEQILASLDDPLDLI
ncbi:lipase family protein [Pseudomonas entomophila]|uniref:lipase family protein n=1 Tax=Pseudomonas entomophila TaxID=312306 RepID=UPI001BCDCF07|nr:lipase family protein [Pseudomonas entomophila]QVM92866.1 lipase family protein [Pseudomonas entomophila]